MYYKDAINGRKNHPNELWKFFNAVLPNKRANSPYPSKLILEEKIFGDPVDISKQFNNYFVEIGQSRNIRINSLELITLTKMYYKDAINGRKNHPKELWKFFNAVLPNKRANSPYPSKLIDFW